METDAQVLERLGTDGRKWAEEFVRMNGHKFSEMYSTDELIVTLHGWFANAIEAGRSEAEFDNTPVAMSRRDVASIVSQAAGAASAPFMRDHPQYVMPSDEIGQGIREVVQDSLGFDMAQVRGYRGLAG
jgi:hypothetical protein